MFETRIHLCKQQDASASVLLVSFLQGRDVMVEEDFLFLLPIEGVEPLVTTVTSTELLKSGSAQNNKDNGEKLSMKTLSTNINVNKLRHFIIMRSKFILHQIFI